MNGHMIPDQVLHRAEALAEARPLARVPKSPFAFIWFLVRNHFRLKVAVLMALAASATAIDAFGPLGVSHLINAITGAVKGETDFDTAVLPWIFVLGGIWLGAAIVYRG
jgi:hypothetical protein